jgi:hypothetical protein
MRLGIGHRGNNLGKRYMLPNLTMDSERINAGNGQGKIIGTINYHPATWHVLIQEGAPKVRSKLTWF